MEQDRRAFLERAGKFIVLTGAASVAWDYVLAGAPEQAPGYVTTEHWWGMVIDIDKCIGCGNCARACKAENDVPTDEPGCYRTWVERYQVSGADMEHPTVDSPDGAYDGFPVIDQPGAGVKVFFVPKLCNHCAHSPCVQVCPVGATFESPDGVVLVDKDRLPRLPVLRAGLPVRVPLHRPAHPHGRQVHALLSPHHQGPDDGVLRGVPDRRATTGRPQEPGRPRARVPAHPQGARPETRRWRPAPRSTTTASTGRCARETRSCKVSRASSIPTKSSCSGACSSCCTRTSRDWSPARSSSPRSNASSTWRPCARPTGSRC